MWVRSWRELQSGEVRGRKRSGGPLLCADRSGSEDGEATELSRREGKGDCGSFETFWDGLIVLFDRR